MAMVETLRLRAYQLVPSEMGRKALKYSMASVVGVVVTQLLLLITYTGLGLSATAANVWSVSLSALPVYLLNRAWVWRKTGTHSFSREVAPFWGMALLGLALSTWFVTVVEARFTGFIFVSGANMAAFGVLWVAKFLIIEKFMFGAHTHAVAPDREPLDSLPLSD